MGRLPGPGLRRRGQVVLRSRQGTLTGSSFPEIVAGAAQLPDATALDGELVVWEEDRLAFEPLQGRLARRGAAAAQAAGEQPAHLVIFDLLQLSGTDTTSWSCRRRRATLESVAAARRLSAPWTLCPSTTDPEQVAQWLSWTTGPGGDRLQKAGQPVSRFRARVAEVQDATHRGRDRGRGHRLPDHTRTLLLGRYEHDGRLQYVGRTTTLPRTVGHALTGLLAPAGREHPWTGWTFLRRVGHEENVDRDPRVARAGGGGRCRYRPGCRRPLAPRRALAPRPPRSLPRRSNCSSAGQPGADLLWSGSWSG
ncbi:ATP-dependent DNA ligase [Streptomyces sp. ALI-76-A]|nr:ATP-dependent DNA ligase [Streptomyces sp. ALI-76-A]MDL5206346.1 ATP-dependent DNA ligase [Streptomyces sp. ALI-76-A]